MNHRSTDLFLAGLSHELRSPLTSIISWVQLLIQGNLTPEKVAIGLNAIETCAQTQNLIINDLVNASEVILGDIAITRVPINLIEVLVQSINTTIPAAEQKNIALTSTIPFTSIIVLADSVRLQQVFWNILLNAIKFTPDGGTIKIKVALKRRGNKEKVCIYFIDNGIGVKKEYLEAIFELYQQADISFKKYDGLGVGLTLAASILRLHQGSIKAVSKGLDKGTSFVITLPVFENS